MEYKAQLFEVKSIPEGKNLYIEGYAAVFGNVDTYKDVLLPGSCEKSITGPGASRIKLCAQHKQTDIIDVIGKVVELKEREKGLWFRAKISNTTKGRDAAELILDEAIDEVSIGYVTIDYYNEGGLRYLKEIDIREISIVIRAANLEARLESMEIKEDKRKDQQEELTDDELLQKRAEIDAEIEKRAMDKFLKSI